MPLLSFDEALRFLAGKELFPTSAGSAQLRELGGAFFRQATVSARMDVAEYLQVIADVTEKVVNPQTATRADGTPFTEGMDQATAMLKLKEAGIKLGVGDALGGESLQDPMSLRRRALVVKTNVQVAQGMGHFVESNDADVLDGFPCWELIRFEGRKATRDWRSRWMAAAQDSGDSDAASCAERTGRMVARKDSPIWDSLGSMDLFDDGLGNPFPPFAFGSGMWTVDVSRADAVELGVIKDGDAVEAKELPEPEVDLSGLASELASQVMG